MVAIVTSPYKFGFGQRMNLQNTGFAFIEAPAALGQERWKVVSVSFDGGLLRYVWTFVFNFPIAKFHF